MTKPMRVSVDASRNKMERSENVATNLPLFARAIDRTSLSPSRRIWDSASWEPVETSKALILLWDSAKICLLSLDQANGVIGVREGMSVLIMMSSTPLRLSKIRIEPSPQAVARCSPFGENLIPLTRPSCLSGPTSLSPVVMFQMLALWSGHPVPVANLVESGEMSTAHTQLVPSTLMTFSCMSPSHTLAPS